MASIRNWVISKKAKINAFAPIFLATYFLILVLPYCTGRIPVLYQAICVNVIGRVAFRLIPTAYIFGYGLLAGIANQSKIRWEWVFPIVALWVTFLIAWITTPDTYVFVSASWNRSLTYSTTTVGWLDELISFGTLVAETSILIIWISIIPDAVRNKRGILVPLITVTAFAWVAVIASLALEWDLYIRLFKGGDHKLIHSIFFQKNEYGAFMFMGTFTSCFLGYFKRGWTKYLFGLSAVLLTLVTFLVRCYTAFMSEMVVVVALLLAWVLGLRKKNKVLSWSLLGVGIGGVALLIFLAYAPGPRENIAFLRIVYNSLNSVEKEIETRTVIWAHLPEVINGHQLFFGVTDGISDAKLASLQVVDQEGVVVIFHNSYVAYLAIHGLIGLLVYFALIFNSVKRCLSFRKGAATTSVFLLLLLIGYLLQGMAETYVLFIKMSVLTLPLTYVFFVFLPALKREGTYAI